MALRIWPRTALIEPVGVRSFHRAFTCSTRLRDDGQGLNSPTQPPPESRPPAKPFTVYTTPPKTETFSALHNALKKGAQNKAERKAIKRHSRGEGDQLEAWGNNIALQKLATRRWKAGDVYAPHDLSAIEMKKWKRGGRPTTDSFDALAMNPLNEYKNFSILGEYMTDMGRIKHSSETGLRSVNQRRIARAIRRSVGMGLMPSVHKHPEILQIEQAKRSARSRAY
ncbi:hypothetical protein MMC16_005315 [Acarospora aff. strigata]|nr:hypothetical protein [Acarospora aff. strigata]